MSYIYMTELSIESVKALISSYPLPTKIIFESRDEEDEKYAEYSVTWRVYYKK